MNRRVSKEECDLILQGAVILAGGGGGPLHFARYILHELEENDEAVIARPGQVKRNDWLTMIALVGTPSKVQLRRPSDKSHGNLSQLQSPRNRSQREQQCQRGQRRRTKSNPASTLERLVPSLYERLLQATSVNFLSSSFKNNHRNRKEFKEDDALTPNNAARNAFLYLQKQCRQRADNSGHYNRLKNFRRFSYLLTGELGAVNMATALYLAATEGVAVVDCDGAGRSVPQVNQITYAEKFQLAPTAIVSPEPGPKLENIASTLLDLPNGSEKMVEHVAGSLIADEKGPFSPYIGYGTYVIKGEQMKDVPVFGSYSLALDVGKAMSTFYGAERAAAVSQALTSHGRPNRVIFHGFVKTKVLLADSSIKDNGYIDIEDKEISSIMRLWYRNEIIMAGRPGEIPTYMAPDSICIIPANGEAMDISSIPNPTNSDQLEVYILVIQADDKIKTEHIIKSFESIYPTFASTSESVYNGKYIPWYAKDEVDTGNDNTKQRDVLETGLHNLTLY